MMGWLKRLLGHREVEWSDPTYGQIDRDIQESVAEALPQVSLGTRVAIENTLQGRRDRGLPGSVKVYIAENSKDGQ